MNQTPPPPNDAAAAASSTLPAEPLIQMGHTFKGAPFFMVKDALPRFPSYDKLRHWGALYILMHGRWISQRENFPNFAQTAVAFTIHELRYDFGWKIMRCPATRPAQHFDATKDITRADLYYMCSDFRKYVLTKLGGQTKFDSLVPKAARVTNVGCRATAKQKKQAEEFLNYKISTFSAPTSKMDERLDSPYFNAHQGEFDQNEGDFGRGGDEPEPVS